jgi:hypothetical protein
VVLRLFGQDEKLNIENNRLSIGTKEDSYQDAMQQHHQVNDQIKIFFLD